jgi:predicted amidohydrolase
MNAAKLAEEMNGHTVSWMKKKAAEHRVALCGSLIIQENGNFYNRLLFAEPSGEIHSYDKRHLFTMGNENEFFSNGTERLIVNYKGWRIFPLICYDLRFPVWARNRNEYDLLFYSANWPKSRVLVWETLLKARAIENQCYTAGANRIGVDGNGIEYSGNSQVIDPKGIVMAESKDYTESIIEATLSRNDLLKFRAAFPVLDDGDDFHLEN